MSKRSLVLEAADAIADRLYPSQTSYCVGTIYNLIICVPTSQKPPNFKLVRKYCGVMLENGLSPADWYDLERALIKHFKEEGICLNHQ